MNNSGTDGMSAPPPFWLRPEDCRVGDLARCIDRHTSLDDYPLASKVEQQVLIYDCDRVRDMLAASATPETSPAGSGGGSSRSTTVLSLTVKAEAGAP